MRKIFPIIAILLISFKGYSQAPNKFSFQAVIRNATGDLIKNDSVGVRISLLQGSENGNSAFTESHSLITNSNGLISLEIGGGTLISGSISSIDWGAGPYFIKTETDPNGGVNYVITGTTQLLSVPYALFSANGNNTNPQPAIPHFSTAERDTLSQPIPQAKLIYNTTTQCFEAYNATSMQWVTGFCIGCETPGGFSASAASNISLSSFTANWQSSIGASTYFIDVSTSNTFGSFVGAYNNYNVGNDTTFNISGLNCGNYYYRIRANNSCGSTAASATITVTTNPSGVPASPSASNHTPSQTQIIWKWNTVTGATGYKWNTLNNYSSATDNGTSITKTQTSLNCGTSYNLYVWAYNSCGNSPVTTLTQTTLACGPPPCSWNNSYSFTDSRDGKVYDQVQIGTQCWMAENLDYSTTGSFTPSTSGQSATGTQKYCYNDNPSNCSIYGGLYSWGEMMNGSLSCNGTGSSQPECTTPIQGVCPSGWHIPSHYEWVLLEKNVGSDPGAFPYDISTTGNLGTDEGGNLKQSGTSLWTTPNTGATNSSGFNALPGGRYSGGFFGIGTYGNWWSTTEGPANCCSWGRALNYDNSKVGTELLNEGMNDTWTYSVRCIKD